MKLRYIHSLHRSFNQQLKTSKWVCDFVSKSKRKIPLSDFNLEFYLFMINELHEKYKLIDIEAYNGLPSKLKVNSVFEFINYTKEKDLFEEIKTKIKKRTTKLDRDIYTTYKATSYFINLAKEKFKLLNDKNLLTQKGEELIRYKSTFFNLTNKEKEFFFLRILESDFHIFISICYFIKLGKKYNIKDISNDSNNEFLIISTNLMR